MKAMILAAGLGIAGPERHVEAAAYLLVVKYLSGETCDALVGTDGKLADML